MIRGKCFTLHTIIAIVCFICAGSVDMSRLKSANKAWTQTTQQKPSQRNIKDGKLQKKTGIKQPTALKETTPPGWNLKDYKGKKFIKADMRKAKLSNVNFQGSDLTGADLSGADLRNCNFTSAKLVRAKLNNANCEKVNFRRADCSYADFNSTRLSKANFTLSTLYFAKLHFQTSGYDNLPTKSLFNAINLRNANFVNLKASRINLNNKDLRSCIFKDCGFIDASFVKTNLNNATLDGGSFLGVDFTDANLDNIKLKGNPYFHNAKVHIKYAGILKGKVLSYETIRFYN